MLVRNLLSDNIDIPHEAGEWMRFRRLNGRRIAECLDRRQTDAMVRMKALGSDGLAMIRDAQKDRDPNTPVAKQSPLEAYDKSLLLLYGIAEWSYEADPKTELASEDGGLDAKTADWACTELLKFNGLWPADADTQLGN